MEIFPKFGVAFFTDFEITFTNWVDFNLPISYQLALIN